MNYIHLDESGKVQGIYNDEIHCEFDKETNTYDLSSLPTPYVALDNENVLNKIINNDVNTFIDNEWKYIDYRRDEEKAEFALLNIKNSIYEKYSMEKQSQDLMWTNYHRTNLVAQGETNVEQKVVGMVLEVQDGKTVEEALSAIDADKKVAYEKLVKVGLRTAWAEKCIEEGLAAMDENREPNYPPFPEV